MKLFIFLTVCAFFCLTIAYANPELQDEEGNEVSLDELLDILADQAEAESMTKELDEKTSLEEALSQFFSRLLEKKTDKELEQNQDKEEITALNKGTLTKLAKDTESDNNEADSQWWWASGRNCYCAFGSFGCPCHGK